MRSSERQLRQYTNEEWVRSERENEARAMFTWAKRALVSDSKVKEFTNLKRYSSEKRSTK